MSRLITRRTLVTAGLTTAAAASGLGAAIRYGLIPPDYGGIIGIGRNADLFHSTSSDLGLFAGARIQA